MANIFAQRKQKLDLLKALRPKGRQDEVRIQYVKCTDCLTDHSREMLKTTLYLCPRCGCYLRMPGRARLEMVFDKGQFREKFIHVQTGDPIAFPGYRERVAALKRETGLEDACLCGIGLIGGNKAICAALDAAFLMGSMGTAVGEKVALAAEYARINRLPLIIFSASGGARMQEGIFSLMQMAKTAAAIRRLDEAGGLFISCVTHPTTGGVTASFASLGDYILAEPGALMGFAGPRVIEQTIGEALPPGFQRSEFQLEHGFVDAILPRAQLRQGLIRLLALHKR